MSYQVFRKLVVHHVRSRQRGRCDRYAFSLIELLVVVSIIALLLGLLLPVLSGARRQAKSAVCLSNLRQLGILLETYSRSYDGSLPQIYGGSVSWEEQRGAFYQLLVHSGIATVRDLVHPLLVCPESDPHPSISYVLNAVAFGYLPPDDTEDPGEDDPDGLCMSQFKVHSLRFSQVHNASRMVSIYDVNIRELNKILNGDFGPSEADISDQFSGTDDLCGKDFFPNHKPSPSGFAWLETVGSRPRREKAPHNSGHNFLFMDTHAVSAQRWEPSIMTRLSGRAVNDAVQ